MHLKPPAIVSRLALCLLSFLAVGGLLSGTSRAQSLSHESLFAPNKTFGYFADCGVLDGADPSSFSFANAAFLAQCSLLIYVKEPAFIEETLKEAGFAQTEFFAKEGTFAFLTENDEHLVIAFRGTETGDKEDYLTDAKVRQEPFTEHGTAHTGFIQALALVESELYSTLQTRKQNSPNKTVWVTGHSLGGALATLFSIRYMDSVDALYTVGSPRCVGQKLAVYLQDELPLFRIVNNNDIVTRVPTPPFYEHIGPTYYLTATHELIVDPPFSQTWKERLKGHNKFIKRLISEHWMEKDFSAIPSDYFVDHSPRLYAEILIALSKEESL